MKINQLKIGAVLSYLSMGLGYLVSIIYTPIMLRLLGQSEFGLYNLVASVVAYLGVLNFGFGSAYTRYFSRYKVKEDKAMIANLNGMFLIIFSTIGIVAVIAGVTLVINTERIFGTELTNIELSRAKILMGILVINLAISFPNIIFTSYITANEKFIFQKIVEMVRLIINPFVVLPLLILGYGSVGMVLSTTILNVTIEIANLIYCVKKLNMRFSFSNFDFRLMREMTVFSSFIFINLIVDQINWNVDKFILGRFHGTSAVAVYGIAAQLNTYYISIATTISSVFIPRVHRLVATKNKNGELEILFTKIGRIQFIILSLIFSGLVFFGKAFIKMWAGVEYVEAYIIVLLLTSSVTIPLVQNIGIEIQRAKNMHQFRSWVYFFIALINLSITVPLARVYSGIGAAIGTAISLIIGNGLLMSWYNHTKIKIDMLSFWKEILKIVPALFIPIVTGTIINIHCEMNTILQFVILGMIYIITFCTSMWCLGMNNYEKKLLSKPIKNFFRQRFSYR